MLPPHTCSPRCIIQCERKPPTEAGASEDTAEKDAEDEDEDEDGEAEEEAVEDLPAQPQP